MSATTLLIYISEKCQGCREARKMAAEMSVEFPEVRIELVERERAAHWPEEIIATPAYVLNGRLVSWGNPSREHLRRLLARA